jgi:uncharacterized protein (DUF58 family)
VADSWQQVGLLLVTGFNCGYVLSFSNLMMVPLGWWWGAACLLLVAGAAWYANWLLAGLHLVDGHRFIRYRDLMGSVFGTYARHVPRSSFNSSIVSPPAPANACVCCSLVGDSCKMIGWFLFGKIG